MSPFDDPDLLPSRKLTDEERHYLEYAVKEPVDSLTRLDEVAKFLLGASATTSGLFVAAYKFALGPNATLPGLGGWLPFLLWAGSILAFLRVLLPQTYQVGQQEPASWKAAVLQARTHKYHWLQVGTWAFCLGIVAAVYPLIAWK